LQVGFRSSFFHIQRDLHGILMLGFWQVHSGPSKGIKMFLPALPGNNYLGKLFVCLPNAHQGIVQFRYHSNMHILH
jgi:hypothetical protein